MRVAVLKGGRSLERAVSLRSGARVEDALATLGHSVVPFDVGENLVSLLRGAKPDVAFIAMHGPGGEDGTVQELLEILEIPYTGPGIASCLFCTDKILTKYRLREAGIKTPDWVAFNSTAFRGLGAGDLLGEIESQLGFPLVVKPASGGSSLGVGFAAEAGDVAGAIVAAFSYDDRVLLERHVGGRELAVSLLAGGEILPPVEVIPNQADRFNYEARYEIGRTRYSCPAELGVAHQDAVATAARGAWDALDCEGFARVDLLLGDDGPDVIDVNAVPGLTDTSLLPMAAEAAGISFEQFVERALERALEG